MTHKGYSEETIHALLKKEFEYLKHEFEDLRAELREDSKNRVTRAEFEAKLESLERDFESRVKELKMDITPIKRYFNLIATIIVGAIVSGVLALIMIK